jgi:sugar transferase (PEP-CTERM/EpsH1 system associated)
LQDIIISYIVLKIFVLLSRVPYPLEKGDKLRAYNQVKALSKRHEIYLFALNDAVLNEKSIEVLTSFCKEVHVFRLTKIMIAWNLLRFFFSGKPLQCGYFYSKRAQRRINKLLTAINPDHIYAQLIRTAEYVKQKPIKKTLDYQDVFSKGLFRLMEQSSPWKRFFYNMEYKRVKRYETEIFTYFDNKTIITKVDRDQIAHHQDKEIIVIPNGVDVDFFQPMECEKQFDLIFTGNMSYTPNVRAAEYLVKMILPQLLKKYPDIRLVLCGTTPSNKVLALQSRNVIVTGWVEDIRLFYAQSRIFIAPMQLGTGLQNKLLEAMAMKIPCITSPLASKPLDVVSQKEIIICNSILGYIDAIDMLLTQPNLYNSIAINGYEFVKKNYNWNTTTEILENLIVNT